MFISGYEWPIACAEVVKYCGLWSGLALGLELSYMERKCADTTGTVPIPGAGHYRL